MKKEYTKEKLEEVIINCTTYRQVLIAFNRNDSSKSYECLKSKIKEFGIDTSHFLKPSEVIKNLFKEGKLMRKENSEIFTQNSKTSRSCVKKRLIDDKLIEYVCFKCGNIGEWMGEKITLILDHINGVNNDHRLENLRFVCPNCNSTLETHCQGSKVFEDKKVKLDKRKFRKDRHNLRKVEWPNKELLLEMLKNMSYVSIGKKYGVSDVAVRKWAKKYQIL